MKLNWKHYISILLIITALIFEWFIIGKIYWWNVAASVPSIFLFVLPIIILILSIKEKKKLFFIFSSIILLFIIIPKTDINPYALQVQKDVDDTAIKVMGWNTDLWDMRDEYDGLYEFLVSMDQDIYILQEYEYSDNWVPYFIDRFDEIKSHFPDYEILTSNQYVIISKYPIIDHELSETTQVLMAKLDIEGQETTVIDVHIRPHVDLGNSIFTSIFWDYAKVRHILRTKGFREIEDYMAQAEGNPIIVTGDFNTTKFMGGLENISGQLEDTIKYYDKFLTNTWERDGRFLWRIDYFFVNDEIEVLSYDTVTNTKLSDHRAMFVILRLKDNKKVASEL
ncbi:endonuclease/exonuclease/phosphatase family protein [Chengkuizengella marina]|uniref:Endonuclease/exonuclease/phosphatase domain-containing protein n=1 Tax=Chengkuizengella marina TaxID=2507566 RepID=A0A6N9PZF2_9BACL|nr:endonuclease/exonuclease/phosphatase family protein [Chengkuizengella marina]NBI28192.1 hypothetical protein [Chengkuizengella marina]